jgi:hypothetical protein
MRPVFFVPTAGDSSYFEEKFFDCVSRRFAQKQKRDTPLRMTERPSRA